MAAKESKAISHYHGVSERCYSLFNVTWKSICSGSYPEDVKLKYGGKLVSAGEPYSIFQKESEPTHLLMIFRSKSIKFCNSLTMNSMHIMKCIDEQSYSSDIVMDHSHLICVNYGLRMADELVTYCTSNEVPENQFTALYYSNIEDRIREILNDYNNGTMIGANILMLIGLAAIVILLLLRFK